MRRIVTASTLAAVGLLSLTACTGSDGTNHRQPGPRAVLRLGQGADTAGAEGRGTVQITPDTVVYTDRTSFGTPERGLFAVVTFQAMNRGKAAVKTTAGSGGFRWKTPGGHTVEQGEGKGAGKIAPVGFSEGGPAVRPHTYQAETVAFDITAAERGGTLVYGDGDGVAFYWKVPSTSSGPAVPALRSALQ
ncbi:hypothetical protein [Streptomyces sp. DT203]|uniref:hypothetical protein n=1 Tax=Streptomyces sp. DT203 TaxID=3393424 RepID=UPI003CF85619